MTEGILSKGEHPVPQIPILDKLIDHGETGKSELEPAESEVWTEYYGSEGLGGVVAAFYCEIPGVAGDPVIIEGSASGVTTPVNKETTASTVAFAEGKGEQDFIVVTYNFAKEQEVVPSVWTSIESLKWASKIDIRA